MDKNNVKTLISESVRKAGYLTYPQLLRVLESEGVKSYGNFQLEMKDKNVVIWGGLSELVVESLTELHQEGRLVDVACPIELYTIEPMPLPLPITLRVPDEKLASPAVFLTIVRFQPEQSNKVTPIQ